MGTCSYVLVGTEEGMTDTFGSTCHGAGSALSRNASRRKPNHDVLQRLENKGIAIRVASPRLVTEEAPESYKDVIKVVDTCILTQFRLPISYLYAYWIRFLRLKRNWGISVTRTYKPFVVNIV